MTAEARRPFPELPEQINSIHIIGVAGTGMGSLAAMLKSRGYDVRGSDAMAYPPMSTWLEDQGIEIMLGYKESNLDWNPDLVIVGNVCRREYADAVAMRERGFPYLSFPEALQHFFMSGKRNLVITGTHGKTTTTAMLSWILEHAGRDPSFMVGGITGNFKSNYQLKDGESFVVEGDEYDTAYFDKVPKFWHYAPFRATINNLEFDHADIYADVSEIEDVFVKLVAMIPAEGSLWVNGDDPRALSVSENAPCPRRTFGFGESNDLRATNVQLGAMTSADFVLNGESIGRFEIPTIGEFNLRNLLGATAIALDEGLTPAQIMAAAREFVPVKKRQEFKGEANGVLVYDDFAHHPTAVEHTMQAFRKQFPDRKIWAIFEAKSNTSRRKIFQHEYPKGLSIGDEVILSKPWRKDEGLPPEELLDIDELRAEIESMGPPTKLIPDVETIVEYVAEHAKPGDVVLGLSGSAFGGLHDKLLAKIREQ